MTTLGRPMGITFFTKAGCCLCEEALALLQSLTAGLEARIEMVDILSDEELFAKYKHEVPVIVFSDQSVLSGRITEPELLEAICRVGQVDRS